MPIIYVKISFMGLAKILIVSADQQLNNIFKKNLGTKYALLTVENISTAIKIILRENIKLVVLDWEIDPENNMRFLDITKRYKLQAEVLLFVDQLELADMLEITSLGITNFLKKPGKAAEVEKIIENILTRKFLKSENKKLLDRIYARYAYGDFLGRGNYYNLIIGKIEENCKTKDPVLIVGETGTEKDILAYEIYENSSYAEGLYLKKQIRDNTELEDISFIYDVNNGCLVLEDMSVIDRETQKKLNGLLCEHSVNVKVIMLSSSSIEEKVAQGEFDKELYRKISKKEIVLISLRDRIKDLPDIIDNILTIINETNNFSVTGITDEALLLLSRYPWPGNTMQLRTVIMAISYRKQRGEITKAELPAFITAENEKVLINNFENYFQKTY